MVNLKGRQKWKKLRNIAQIRQSGGGEERKETTKIED